MEIALFMIALVTNIFTILILRFGFIGNYEYKQGMILGVHIPQETKAVTVQVHALPRRQQKPQEGRKR